MTAVLGMNCKLFRNTGSYASPTWDEVTNTKDVTQTVEKSEADATTRANNGWRATMGALKDATVEFQMVWNPGDADFEAFRDAFLNDTLIDCAALDGDMVTSGSQGLRAEFSVLTFSRNEPLEEVVTVDVTLKPGYTDNAPVWMEVA